MQLKRIHDWDAPMRQWTRLEQVRHHPLTAPNGDVITEQIEPPVRCVRVLHASGRQRFSPRLVETATAQGWMEERDGRIVITTEAGPVSYRIERMPGRYCCHCGEKLPDDDDTGLPGGLARAHVAAKHAGKKSPDKDNPAGYLCIRYYDCVREG